MDYQAVIPEFMVSDIEKSRHFYCDLLGFSVEYERPEEKFLFLSILSDAVSIFPLASRMSLSSTKNYWKLTIPSIVR